jgi:hypothetical protein
MARTIYDAEDQLIGVMDTPELAERVVWAANALVDDHEHAWSKSTDRCAWWPLCTATRRLS